VTKAGHLSADGWPITGLSGPIKGRLGADCVSMAGRLRPDGGLMAG
jgi:hypothetical protein